FNNIPFGRYQLLAHLDRVPDVVETVELTQPLQTIDLQLTLAPVSEQVTVTATGSAEGVGSAYQSASSVGALELSQRNPTSIGEALEYNRALPSAVSGPLPDVRLFAASTAIGFSFCRMVCVWAASRRSPVMKLNRWMC